MKVYISLPITGMDIRAVKRSSEAAKKKLKKMNHEPVSPIDITPDQKMPYSYYMGVDIMALLECEAVIFLRGWQNSKGCMLEFQAAVIYGKEILFEL